MILPARSGWPLEPASAKNTLTSVGDSLLDKRVERLSEHLLLVLWRCPSKTLRIELLSSCLRRRSALGVSLRRSKRHLRTSGHGTSGKTLRSTNGRSAVGIGCRSGRSSAHIGRSHRVLWHTGVRHLRRRHPIGHVHPRLTGWSVSWSCLLHHLLRRVSHHRASHARHHSGLSTVAVHRRVRVHGCTHVSRCSHTASVGHSLGLSLLHLRLQGLSSHVLALGEGDVEGLGADHLAVHVLDSLGGFIGGGVADKAKVLQGSTLNGFENQPAHPRCAIVILHDLAAGDGTEGLKLGSETVVIPLV